MTELFLKIINMSISASWVVLAVLVSRFILKKAPKWVNVLLWGVVAIRLLCPFSIESALSLIPNAETISPELMVEAAPSTQGNMPTINTIINQTAASQHASADTVSANPLQFRIHLLAGIWAAGIAALLLYSAISYRSLYNRVRTAVRLCGSIYQSENVSSPFILGIIKPKIYLPFSADGQNMEYAAAHEQAHIRRRDHWWKPLGFLLLAIHWFNPIMWLAYILLCRDIELACDEKVIKDLGNEQRADYSDALLSCSINKRMITVCPLAFGETGIKERVKSVINYKKPAVWLIAVSIIACIVLGVCFLTDPEEAKPKAWPELEDIRTGYTKEQAEEDGCVVIEGCTLLAGEKSWLEFVNKTQAGNSAIVRVYQAYTTDSDLEYTVKELSYDGEKFCCNSMTGPEIPAKSFCPHRNTATSFAAHIRREKKASTPTCWQTIPRQAQKDTLILLYQATACHLSHSPLIIVKKNMVLSSHLTFLRRKRGIITMVSYLPESFMQIISQLETAI